jgi:hypothetical protein
MCQQLLDMHTNKFICTVAYSVRPIGYSENPSGTLLPDRESEKI